MREMTVESVRINLQTQQRVTILKEKELERYLFIWTAHAEAYAIAVELQGTPLPQPLMHDLFKNAMDALGVKMVNMVIWGLVDDIFRAKIVFEMANNYIEVEARPSDAIAIALRARIPIYVEDSVMENAGVSLETSKEASGPTKHYTV